jgi:hypothetical protein
LILSSNNCRTASAIDTRCSRAYPRANCSRCAPEIRRRIAQSLFWHRTDPSFARCLTAEDLDDIAEMTPRSVRQLREEEEMRKFLEGQDPDKPASKAQPHKHSGG